VLVHGPPQVRIQLQHSQVFSRVCLVVFFCIGMSKWVARSMCSRATL
jgi:hypothetical protein